MVLAAHNMQDEEGIDETNYFVRLRDLLWLANGRGRPDGMPAGAEEALWKAWNRYLTAAGFQTTAQRGSGAQTYLRYVFSQAILRESDKQHLRQRFSESQLPPHLDTPQLGGWLSRQAIIRKHLKEGLHHPDPGRRWEFYLSAHRVYEEAQWEDSDVGRKGSEQSAARSIECGLYLIEDLMGGVEYWLFPRQPARALPAALSVGVPGSPQAQPLRPLRAGFFAPLWPQEPFVDQAIDLAVVGDPGIRTALFPRHDFWLLIRDPEDPLGAWATWRPYLEVGERLLVLCRPGLFAEEMERLHDAKLLEWAERVEGPGWIEYRGCMVLSYDWGAFIPNPGMPCARGYANPSLGCRCQPERRSARSQPECVARRVSAEDEDLWFRAALRCDHHLFRRRRGLFGETPCQVEVPLPANLEPGVYTAEVNWGGRLLAIRTFRVIPWDEISVHPHPDQIASSSISATAGLALYKVVDVGRDAECLSGTSSWSAILEAGVSARSFARVSNPKWKTRISRTCCRW